MFYPRPAGQASTSPTLESCYAAKQAFLSANMSKPDLIGSSGGDMPMPILSAAGEAAFVSANPTCAAIIASCALPWMPGGSGSYQTIPGVYPYFTPTYTWNTEADRLAWIAAHPNCGPYPPPVAAVIPQNYAPSQTGSGVLPTAQTAKSAVPAWALVLGAIAVAAVVATYQKRQSI